MNYKEDVLKVFDELLEPEEPDVLPITNQITSDITSFYYSIIKVAESLLDIHNKLSDKKIALKSILYKGWENQETEGFIKDYNDGKEYLNMALADLSKVAKSLKGII